MASYYESTTNVGSSAPRMDISGLLASTGAISKGLDAPRQRALEEEKLARQKVLESRQDTEWQQKQDAVAKKLASEKAMKDFIANPNLYQYADRGITKAADDAVVGQFESGKMKGLMDRYAGIKDDKEAQDFYMKEIDPLNRKMQATYENAPVYKEGVKSGVFQDMLEKGVDVNTADAISKRYAEGFGSLKDIQAAQDSAAKAAFDNNMERAKILKDLNKSDKPAKVKEYEYRSKLTPAQQKEYDKTQGRNSSDSEGKDITPAWAKLLDESTWLDEDRETVRSVRKDYIQGDVTDSEGKSIGQVSQAVVDKALNKVVPMFASDGDIRAGDEFYEALHDEINRLNTKSTAKNIAGSVAQGSTGGAASTGRSDNMTKGIVDLLTPVQAKNVRKTASDRLLGEIEGIFGKSAGTKESSTGGSTATAKETNSNNTVSEADDLIEAEDMFDADEISMRNELAKEEKGKNGLSQWSTQELEEIMTELDPVKDKDVYTDYQNELASRNRKNQSESTVKINSLDDLSKLGDGFRNGLDRFDNWAKGMTYNDDGTINKAGAAQAAATVGTSLGGLGGIRNLLFKDAGKNTLKRNLGKGVTGPKAPNMGDKFRMTNEKTSGKELLDLVNNTPLKGKNTANLGNTRTATLSSKTPNEVVNDVFGRSMNKISKATKEFIRKGDGEIPMTSKLEAEKVWEAARNAARNGSLKEEQLVSIIKQINDKGLIPTRKLLESLDDLAR